MKTRFISCLFLVVSMFNCSMLAAAVPGQVNFQGVLLDNASQPVNGTADFDFALYDASTGGNLLWSESQTGVTVSNGAYSVALGSVSPISPGILSGGTVHLEVTVDSDTLSPRQQLLAVPYALEASSVEGVSGTFIQQIFQHVNYDGQSLANDHPDQGFDDVDGDGLANFIDPDNDNDGVNDSQELIVGSSVNLFSPFISNVVNTTTGLPRAKVGDLITLSVTGSGFLAGLTVQFGSENPVPQNLTSTSFDVTVGAGQTSGASIDLVVTLPNSETDTAENVITYFGKYVFLTGSVQTNAMDQTTAFADNFCNTAASNAGLTGTYVAWFSDADTGIGPLDRFTASEVWARIDGVIVANDLADLTDGTIAATINVEEDGNVRGGGTPQVATNTLADGMPDPLSCSAANPATGFPGSFLTTTSAWSRNASRNCTTSHRYYCFEQ